MCAGVQNVSRPIVRCHEMSQFPPTTTLVEAKTTAQTKKLKKALSKRICRQKQQHKRQKDKKDSSFYTK